MSNLKTFLLFILLLIHFIFSQTNNHNNNHSHENEHHNEHDNNHSHDHDHSLPEHDNNHSHDHKHQNENDNHDHDHHNHNEHDHHNEYDNDNHNPKTTQIWSYTTLALILVWLVSIMGAIVPKKFVLKHSIQFIAFSAGALLATIFIEFIPHSFSVAAKYKNISQNTQKTFRFFSLAMLSGLAIGFIVELFSHLASLGHIHGHRGCGDECEEIGSKSLDKSQIPTFKSVSDMKTVTIDKNLEKTEKSIVKETDKYQRLCSFIKETMHTPSIIKIDFFAKFLHHFVDGILVGSNFLININSGWIITIGVMAHEISSSLGGFALYLSFGLRKKVALVYFLLSGSTLIFGGFLTLLLKNQIQNSSVSDYIPIIIVGMLLYIVLSDYIPLILHKEHHVHGSKEDLGREIKLMNRIMSGLLTLSTFGLGFGLVTVLIIFTGHSH